MSKRRVLIPFLIAINVFVFGLWSYLPENFMADHFAVSYDALIEGRLWTLLTAEFSHILLWHLLFNMIVLNSFGGLLEEVLGKAMLLRVYIFSAMVASMAHALVSGFILHQPGMPAVGASGAIAGLLLLFTMMFPREKILLFFFVPLPAFLGALAFVGLDLWGLIAQYEGGGLPIGHGAHLGGALAGVISYRLWIHKRWKRISALYKTY